MRKERLVHPAANTRTDATAPGASHFMDPHSTSSGLCRDRAEKSDALVGLPSLALVGISNELDSSDGREPVDRSCCNDRGPERRSARVPDVLAGYPAWARDRGDG